MQKHAFLPPFQQSSHSPELHKAQAAAEKVFEKKTFIFLIITPKFRLFWT